MKPYISLFRVRFINGLQYRAAAFGGLTTQFFWGIMLIFMYEAFYQSGGSSGEFSYRDLVSFVWLQQACLSFIFLYDWDAELYDMILTGGISYELCRPISLYHFWYVKLLSKRFSRGVMRLVPIILVALIMPYPYNLSPPESLFSFFLFVVTLLLGLLLLVAISMLVYISVFKTLSPAGSVGIFGTIGDVFGGTIIPIPLMPDWMQRICMFLPFRWVADLPFRIYLGNIGTEEALISVVVQIMWITLLVFIGSLIMRKIARLSVVQGG